MTKLETYQIPLHNVCFHVRAGKSIDHVMFLIVYLSPPVALPTVSETMILFMC